MYFYWDLLTLTWYTVCNQPSLILSTEHSRLLNDEIMVALSSVSHLCLLTPVLKCAPAVQCSSWTLSLSTVCVEADTLYGMRRTRVLLGNS